MKDSAKYNLIAFVLLLLLTATSGLLASGQAAGMALVLPLALAACVKVSLVVWQFMEMKKAHRAWLVLVGVVLMVFFGVVTVFNLG